MNKHLDKKRRKIIKTINIKALFYVFYILLQAVGISTYLLAISFSKPTDLSVLIATISLFFNVTIALIFLGFLFIVKEIKINKGGKT